MAKRELLRLPPNFKANLTALLQTPPPSKAAKRAKTKVGKSAKKVVKRP